MMPRKTGETQADYVRRIRKRLGLSQAAFGKLVGRHPITVSKWERGLHGLDTHTEHFLRGLKPPPIR